MTQEVHSIDRLRQTSSVSDILAMATGFESAARDFYTGLVPKVSKRIRYLVEELAAEEQKHFDLLTALNARTDIAEQVKLRIQQPASDSKFSDGLHLPNLGDNPDDQTVLQYAMGREHIAMTHYTELAQTAPAGPIRELFQFLSSEETTHKLELEKLYYETVYRGGGV